ncbi:amidase [Bradyrhizobium betae]|uniref:Indoleacetamide hydrolase n=1 Tax=Bradyrhizobium betae TaxID=244734 RepID=A0A4Q1VRQ4_9BRAD|nr:amidase family protein [Bradyrhizobium betae]RXT54226.1 amidase [Bradyrhizobium betae]
MHLSDYASYDALGLAELIRSGQVAVAEVVDAALAANGAVNERLNAVIDIWPEDVAAQIASAPRDGPFHGVPFLIKDVALQMEGKRSEMGSRLASGLTAAADTHLMQRFRKAGLVTFGRTAAPEMGFSCTTETVYQGPVHNPWNLSRNVGGSSGGTAAAVAAGVVPMAHGNDGGGSIRVPASSCGLVGLKPTRGRVPIGPDADEALNGMGIELGLSRTVRDSAALLDAVQGDEPGDPYVIPAPARPYLSEVDREPATLRIGVMAQPFGGAATSPEVARATAETAEHCRALGHRVEISDMKLGVSWEEFVLGNAQLWTANLAALIAGLAEALGRPIDLSTLEAPTLACYEYGRKVTAMEMLGALGMRNRVTRSLGHWFTRNDVLLSPTLPGLPAPIGEFGKGSEYDSGLDWTRRIFETSPFTPMFNVSGLPAISVPLAFDEKTALPIGMQFAAGFGREDILFQLAGQLERTRPWAARKPAIWAAAAA